jgi:hypothetical protein
MHNSVHDDSEVGSAADDEEVDDEVSWDKDDKDAHGQDAYDDFMEYPHDWLL